MLIILIDVLRLVEIASYGVAHEEEEGDDQKGQHHIYGSLT